jgi:hypothetical protein
MTKDNKGVSNDVKNLKEILRLLDRASKQIGNGSKISLKDARKMKGMLKQMRQAPIFQQDERSSST